jgi:hypothetical protein
MERKEGSNRKKENRRVGRHGLGMYRAWERKEIHKKFWSGNLKGRGHSEYTSVDGKIILEWISGN